MTFSFYLATKSLYYNSVHWIEERLLPTDNKSVTYLPGSMERLQLRSPAGDMTQAAV